MKLWMRWPHVRKRAAHKASCPSVVLRRKIKQDLEMLQATTTISNKLGLHARASAKLTKLAGGFPCEIWIAKGERRVNAKSIMGVMMLAAGIGSEVTIDTEGEQAQEALDAVLAMIADKFGEGE
jgi:phosphocarrier protein